MEKSLKEKLFNEKKIGWDGIEEREKEEIFNFCNDYMKFLNKAKTEREFVVEAKKKAEENGFMDIEDLSKLNPGDKVYYIDNNIGALYSYKYKRNESNEKKDLKLEFYIDRTSESLDISSDGKKVLFVSRTYNGGLYKYIIKEYDLEKKKRTKRKWENIQYARFFKNGIIGIGKDLHNPILIYIDENNNKEILLEANDNFSYISPTVIDDNNIALIISDYGIRHIAIFNYQNKYDSN